MKKYILFFVSLSVIAVSTTVAQVRVNPKIGLNASSLTTENAEWEEDGVRTGVNLGVDFRIGDDGESWFFFQPGIHYYSIGAQLINDANAERVDDVVAINSLKVPLNGGFYLTGTDGILAVRLNGGVVPTFMLGVEDNDLGLDRDDFRSFNLGLNAGIGIDLFFATLDIGYEWGLTEFFEAGEGQNRMFAVSLGVVLP
ncbi:porin family protein [Tunicatimonas pelagia]|uniref:porin family protein n=1 Tax=Tunicatimonas pelagia TaxID=931531 RepID=UPI0026667533|nr:porin family protein [Tunicatimonas pelagia]WKN42038.1 porin family protein [Tunicatimonas pelagia]